jgi:hypothetical protein
MKTADGINKNASKWRNCRAIRASLTMSSCQYRYACQWFACRMGCQWPRDAWTSPISNTLWRISLFLIFWEISTLLVGRNLSMPACYEAKNGVRSVGGGTNGCLTLKKSSTKFPTRIARRPWVMGWRFVSCSSTWRSNGS